MTGSADGMGKVELEEAVRELLEEYSARAVARRLGLHVQSVLAIAAGASVRVETAARAAEAMHSHKEHR